VDVPFNPARNNFTAGMVAFGMNDQAGNQQGLALHLAEHRYLLIYRYALIQRHPVGASKKTNNRSQSCPILPWNM